ncbi:MAG: Uma2 family endonuclease [Actinophytocola sp.]|nr:Uma2 family endonuclease [Actinophytocola sp.]
MAQPAYQFPDYWTEADLDSLPDDGHRYEILDGSLHITPLADGYHQSIGLALAVLLRTAAPSGCRVLPELGVRVPGGNFVPDLVVLEPGADLGATWHDPQQIALVVEVASPSTEVNDKTSKAFKYAEAGIPAYWRVARDGTITVHALVDQGQYGIVTTVKPGTTWTASLPFPVTLEPDALVADF